MPDPFDINGWYVALSEPVPLEQGLGAPWQGFIGGSAVVPAYVGAWHMCLSEPVRFRDHIAINQQWLAIDANISWDIKLHKWMSWFNGLSEPVRWKKAVPWQQPLAIDAQAFIYPAVAAQFRMPLSEPVRVKPRPPHFPFFETDWEWKKPETFFRINTREMGDVASFVMNTVRIQKANVTIVEITPNLANVAITPIRTV